MQACAGEVNSNNFQVTGKGKLLQKKRQSGLLPLFFNLIPYSRLNLPVKRISSLEAPTSTSYSPGSAVHELFLVL